LFEDRVGKNAPLPPEWAHYESLIQGFLALPGTAHPEYRLRIDEAARAIPETGTNEWTYWVLGYIDLLILSKDTTTAFVLDYKTGKSAYADTQQLKLMALLLFAHFENLHTVHGALWFIKENKVIEATYKRDEQLMYWEHFMAQYVRLREAHATGVFNAKPSGLCSVCPVSTCPHYRGK
jgi:hypothetical protein